jgi:alkyldihydroxyacetonephosphate synthase
MAMYTNRGAPTPPIAFGGQGEVSGRLDATHVAIDDGTLERLRGACTIVDDPSTVAETSRDWWPMAMHWARIGEVAARAAVVARPSDADQVAAVLRICNDARIPVTATAGRSGVLGASIPLHGGVALDLTALAGIRSVDATSMVVDVAPGTFGDVFEDELRAEHGLTVGHWPQSVALSTVGGWLACRGAGQLSGKYGKIEDMVVGLDVVLADGTAVTTGGAPRAAVGPDLTQLFVGSEGTLGIITGARLRAHTAPTHDARAAYGFASFGDALDAMRRCVHRGAHPAVFRLYDSTEANRSYQTGDLHVLLVLDEGDAIFVDATMRVIADECASADRLDDALVEQWLGHRNDVSALQALVERDIVVDTMEIAAPWARLPGLYEAVRAAILGVEHVLVASAHQSHSYADGGCLYFTFAARPPVDAKDVCYRAMWDAGVGAVLAGGGALSHHHGVGLHRSRYVADALGSGLSVLQAAKDALDPNGILNPGKLGLRSPWGASGW